MAQTLIETYNTATGVAERHDQSRNGWSANLINVREIDRSDYGPDVLCP